MIRILVYMVFIISAAMTAAGIILSGRLRTKFHVDTASALLYFQIFIYTFGFYGIWGQVVIKAYLALHITGEMLDRFSHISMLLGLPFLVFAWLMLMRIACELSGRVFGLKFIIGFLVINFTIVVLLGYRLTGNTGIESALLLRLYYLAMNLIYSGTSALLIYSSQNRQSEVSTRDKQIISSGLIVVMVLQCLSVYFYSGKALNGIFLILTFFVGYTFLPVYLSYFAEVKRKIDDLPEKNLSFDEFCSRHEISSREKEIIAEICNGLSNKEIADKLFITLQTVKDHTHRIYIKTNVKSRAQLMNIVKVEGEKG